MNRGHFGLSLPWRRSVSEEIYFSNVGEANAALAKIGIQAVLTVRPEAAALPGAKHFTDSLGQILFVLPLPGIPPTRYPGNASNPLSRLPSGILSAPASSNPPQLLSPRRVEWTRTQEGWLGVPETLDWFWVVLTAFLCMTTPLVLGARDWEKTEGGQAPDASLSRIP